jgi:hypothetical protein
MQDATSLQHPQLSAIEERDADHPPPARLVGFDVGSLLRAKHLHVLTNRNGIGLVRPDLGRYGDLRFGDVLGSRSGHWLAGLLR